MIRLVSLLLALVICLLRADLWADYVDASMIRPQPTRENCAKVISRLGVVVGPVNAALVVDDYIWRAVSGYVPYDHLDDALRGESSKFDLPFFLVRLNLSVEQEAAVIEYINRHYKRSRVTTCVQGTCRALSQAGFKFNHATRNYPYALLGSLMLRRFVSRDSRVGQISYHRWKPKSLFDAGILMMQPLYVITDMTLGAASLVAGPAADRIMLKINNGSEVRSHE